MTRQSGTSNNIPCVPSTCCCMTAVAGSFCAPAGPKVPASVSCARLETASFRSKLPAASLALSEPVAIANKDLCPTGLLVEFLLRARQRPVQIAATNIFPFCYYSCAVIAGCMGDAAALCTFGESWRASSPRGGKPANRDYLRSRYVCGVLLIIVHAACWQTWHRTVHAVHSAGVATAAGPNMLRRYTRC